MLLLEQLILEAVEVVEMTQQLALKMVALELLLLDTQVQHEAQVEQSHHLVDTHIIHLHHQAHTQHKDIYGTLRKS
jgi:hypothetical protein